ncbi:MAG: glycoside hydrolase family 88 protein [Lachnospiraceae bacterium]|nr:glycoside hydrolase family 88 protein [Lachnospiraceae bacterium]
MTDWEKIEEKIIRKETEVVRRNAGRIPYTTESPHRFDDHSTPDRISWWTNGFWGGICWQLYHATKEEFFRDQALFVEEKLDPVLLSYQGMDHDSGFRYLPTSVARCRLEHDPEALNRSLLAATNLTGRFNANGNFIRAWNDWGDGRDTTGWAIIDCMMNLPLLYWASKEHDDPRFYAIALAHARTAARHFIREDGSVRHIVGFDPQSGTFLREYGGQGMADGSSWTRGQAWAVYGFSLSFLHTGEREFLEAARLVADRFLKRMPKEGLMPVDFDQRQDCPFHDSSAAAIAASGLLTLAELTEKPSPKLEDSGLLIWAELSKDFPNLYAASKYLSSAEAIGLAGGESERYRQGAEKLLSILDGLDCDYDPDHDELIKSCSASYHDEKHNFPIIYADYFYIEAILKLTGKALFIW